MLIADKSRRVNISSLLKEDELIYESRLSGRAQTRNELYKVIDLFCGAGGMSLGFSERFGQPFQSVWANDFNKYCADTYNYNIGNHVWLVILFRS